MGLGTRCANFACNLLSWMLGNPHFALNRSIPFPILSILTKTGKICLWGVTNLLLLLLSCERSFLRMWTGKSNIYSFSRPILPQGAASSPRVWIMYLFLLNWVRLPNLNFPNVAFSWPIVVRQLRLKENLSKRRVFNAPYHENKPGNPPFFGLFAKVGLCFTSWSACPWEHFGCERR